MDFTDIAVVGAGPAGLAAAIEAAKLGVDVTLIDENRQAGGQLFKQIHKFFGSKMHMAGIRGIDIAHRLLDESEQAGVRIMLDTVAYGIFDDNRMALVKDDKRLFLQAKKIILATGASENAMSFPGWTRPGVMGAGALQTMMNVNRVLPGKKMLMVGSGNVGLIVSYQALQAGMEVVAVVEAAPRIGGYGVHASKIRRLGVPILTSTTVKGVLGGESVERAIITRVDENWNPVSGTERALEVDTVCLSVGLTPLIELAGMAGCGFKYVSPLGGFVPIHDWNMESNRKALYVAGDISGIEEANTALEEGRLAGLSAAESLGVISSSDANSRKEEIRKRLSELRQGPFGLMRRESKQQLIASCS